MAKKNAVALGFFVITSLGLGTGPASADPSIPDFTEMRALFQKGHVPFPSSRNELRIRELWSCKTAYADESHGKFTFEFFRFLTCLENDWCLYNNQAQVLPKWMPAWFGYANHDELGANIAGGQFLTDKSISSCSGDITKCDLKKGGPVQNDMHIRANGAGNLLVEWTTTEGADLKWDSIVAPGQKVVLYSVCEIQGR